MIPGGRQKLSLFFFRPLVFLTTLLLASATFVADAEEKHGHLELPPNGFIWAAQNQIGQVEVFFRADDGVIWHSRQRSLAGGWEDWMLHGGPVNDVPVAARNSDGRLELFAIRSSNSRMQHNWETGSGGWNGWMDLPDDTANGSKQIFEGHPAVTLNTSNALEVFARGHDSAIWHIQQYPSWSQWHSLGGKMKGNPAVLRHEDGRIEVLAIDVDGHLRCNSQNASQEWSGWRQLGDAVLDHDPTAVFATDGTIEIIARGRDKAVWHMQIATNGIPSPWQSFGGSVKRNPILTSNADGHLEIFAISAANNRLLHIWQQARGWNGWEEIGNAELAENLCAVMNYKGTIEIFASAPENGLVHVHQIAPNGVWSNWETLRGPWLRKVPKYVTRNWQQDDGLPHSTVQTISQTRDGYLWIGTRQGLARFDGVRFVKPTNAVLNRSSIYTIYEDTRGSLWIGSDKGLWRWQQQTLSHYTKEQGLPDNNVHRIYETKTGSIWIGTTKGPVEFVAEKFRGLRDNALEGQFVKFFWEDRSANLCVATARGVFSIKDNSAFDLRIAEAQSLFPNTAVRAVCPGRDDTLWMGTDRGLACINAGVTNGYYQQSRLFTKTDGLSDNIVNTVLEDRAGNLWIGTYSGLNRLTRGNLLTEYNSQGYAFDIVNCLYEDQEGNIWVGDRNGLNRLTPKRFTTFTRNDGLTQENVMSVVEDDEGNILAGTWGGGLNQIKLGQFVANQESEKSIPHLLLGLCVDSQKSLWMGTDFGGGLFHLENGRRSHYAESQGLKKGAVRVILEDREKRLWIGTSKGLNLFDGKQFTNFTVTNGLPHDDIRALSQDGNDGLWIGTQNGLCRWHGGKFTNFFTASESSSNAVVALYQDKSKTLWVGTLEVGLCRVTLTSDNNPSITAITKADGLYSDDICEILEDGSERLWMSCFNGIFSVEKKELNDFADHKLTRVMSTAYGRYDGLVSMQCNNTAKPSALKSRDGRLWFTTTRGLAVIDPRTNAKPKSVPASIVIEEVTADKCRVASLNSCQLASEGSVGDSMTEPLQPLTVPAGHGELEFRYTAFNFAAPEKLRFRYKLDGIDATWVDAGDRRVAAYNHVPPGHYTFRVAVCNADGVWNETGTTTQLRLLPHFWETSWFLVFSGILVLGSVGIGVRYITWRKVQRRMEKLEQQHAIEKERTRIAQDMHDELGSRLTEILLLSESPSTGEQKSEPEVRAAISDVTREIRRNMDAIVWAVNPANDTLDRTVNYLCNYVVKYLAKASIRCRLDVPDDLPALPVSSETRHNLFLAVKETMNNIARHAQATEVKFYLCYDSSKLLLVIEDNGKGFSTTQSHGGNGLLNIRKRMVAIGGSVVVNSEPGKGTRIEFVIPSPR